MQNVRWIPLLTFALIVLVAAGLLLASLFGDELFPEYSPAHRGFQTAETAGCLACHGGVDAPRGSVNPEESQDEFGNVPGIFQERQELSEIRQWIEDGISESRRQSESFLAARERKKLSMPAYGERLSQSEIDDLVAWVALMQYRQRAESTGSMSRGEEIARRHACFTCHGELGQGGVSNPGSLKGYIPGFFGNDFRALTRNGNRQDIREWILHGRSEFFWNQGFAGFYPGRHFTARQVIDMPTYEGLISDEEVEILTDYLVELMELGPMTGTQILEYRPRSARSESAAAAAESGTLLETAAALPGSGSELFREASQILSVHCLECHGGEKQRSGYRLDYRDAAVTGGEIAQFKKSAAIMPGDPGSSLLFQFVTAREEDPFEEIYPMPPEDEPCLSEEQIRTLQRWIEAGAPWPEAEILQDATNP